MARIPRGAVASMLEKEATKKTIFFDDLTCVPFAVSTLAKEHSCRSVRCENRLKRAADLPSRDHLFGAIPQFRKRGYPITEKSRGKQANQSLVLRLSLKCQNSAKFGARQPPWKSHVVHKLLQKYQRLFQSDELL